MGKKCVRFSGVRALGVRALVGVVAVLALGAASPTATGQVAYAGYAKNIAPDTFNQPSSVAADAAGDLFVTNNGYPVGVYQVPAGCMTQSCVVSLGSGWTYPESVAVDSSGNIYVADLNLHAVEMLTKASGYSSMTAVGGYFGQPTGVTVDKNGNIYVADENTYVISEFTSTCTSSSCVTNLGGGYYSYSSVVVDASGNIYGTDYRNSVVRKMTPGCTGQSCTSTVYTGASGGQLDGIALDASGDLYVTDNRLGTAAKVPVGCTKTSCSVSLGTWYNHPLQPAVDGSGNVYIADSYAGEVREVESSGAPNFASVNVGSTFSDLYTVFFTFSSSTTLNSTTPVQLVTTGIANKDFIADTYLTYGSCGYQGTVTYAASTSCYVNVNFAPVAPGMRLGAAQLLNSSGSVIATALISGIGSAPLATYTPGTISTVVGNGQAGYSGAGPSPATGVPMNLNGSYGMAVDAAGNLFIAEPINGVVHKVTASTGVITTVAGTGQGINGTICSTATDGYGNGCPATSANMTPYSVAVDGAGNLYIMDYYAAEIRKVDAVTGVVTAFASTGVQNNGGIAVDSNNNVYFADYYDSEIREVLSSNGSIVTLAGNGAAAAGYSGDGGAASNAQINSPLCLTLDSQNNIYFADFGNGAVRKISNGIITTVAGGPNSNPYYSGGNVPATSVRLAYPGGLAVDPASNVYIGDFGLDYVMKVSASTGILSTVASYAQQFEQPEATGIDVSGNLYVVDGYANLVREISSTPSALSFATTALGATSSDSPQTVTVNNIGNILLTFSTPGTGTNPSISTNFSIGGSSTCPQLSTSSTGTLASGTSCTDLISFSPTMDGNISGQLVTTDNSLNVTGSTQTVSLSGTGTYPTPTVTGLSPTSGSTAGGNTVTITGTGFTGATTVKFGTVAATSFTVGSGGTSITAVAPAHSAGSVYVTVSNPNSISASSVQYTYSTPAPTVTSISPSYGAAAGGGTITITGTGFVSGASVKFGSTSATNVSVISSTSITAKIPGGTAGSTVDVTVKTSNGTSATTSADKYTYQATQTISFTQPTTPVTYGVSPITLSATATSGLPVTFSITSGGAYGTLSGTNNSVLTITGAGSITIAANQAGNSSYAAASTVTRTLVVDKATLTAAIINTPTKTYNGTTAATLTSTNYQLTGLVGTDSFTVTQTAGTYAAATAGTQTVTASLSPSNFTTVSGSLSNYTLPASASGPGTISQANASVTPNPATKVYGASDPALTGTLTGFIAADNVTAMYNRATGSNVGNYTITATLSPTAVLANYNITYNTAQFNITPASASVTPNAATKVYGTADPALTGTLTGFIAADNVTAMYNRVAGSNVGNYTITATLSPTVVLANYNITYNTAQFNITPASASVTPNAATKVYGTADPALTGTLTGFIAADNVTATYSRLAGSNVGNYTITATLSPTAVLANYNITYNTAQFSITPAMATVTANAASKTYGTVNPALTATVGGTLNGDTLNYTLATTATTASSAGQYPITVTLGSNPNYTVTPTNGTLTVNQATPSITVFAPGSITYGTPTLSLSGTLSWNGAATPSGAVTFLIDSTISVPGTCTGSGSCSATYNSASLSAGPHTLSVSIAADTNYTTASSSNVQIYVSKATPTIIWTAPAAITYGTALSSTQLNATASVPGTLTYTPAAGAVLGAGAQTLQVSFTPTDTTDYTSASAQVLLTVNQATPTISWTAPAAITYGTALSAAQLNATASVPGTLTYSPAAGAVLAAGTQTLKVSLTPTDATDYTTASAQVSLTVNQAGQVISFTQPPSPALAGSSVVLSAMGGASGNPVVFSVQSGPASLAADGVTLTYTGVGAVVVAADQAGNVNYTAAAKVTATIQTVAPAYVVTVNTDETSGNGVASNCVATGLTGDNSNCGLRDAVAAANALSGVTTNISFSLPNPSTILIAQQGGITISQSVNLNGPGANQLTLEGGIAPYNGTTQTANNRILQISKGTVSISGLTFTNAYSGTNGSGAAINASGTLTVSNSNFSANLATEDGGAISAYSLTVSGSTFFGNQGVASGAILASNLTVSNSTFFGNQATFIGGAIRGPQITVANSTFSGNSAGQFGGAIYTAGSPTVINSIFSGDSAPQGSGIYAYGITITNIVYNGDSFYGVTPTNSINADPKLSPLGNYGGTTPTMLPLPGSAAICAGTVPSLNGKPLTTDQRGVTISGSRYGQSACYDVGAVQTEYALSATFNLPSLVTPASPVTPAPVATVTEGGTPNVQNVYTVNMTDADSDLSGASTVSLGTSLNTGQATFSNLIFTNPETSDTLTAVLPLNPYLSPALSLTATSNSFQVGKLTPRIQVFAPASITYGTTSLTLSGTLSWPGSITPTGAVTFLIDSTISVPGTCTVSGSCTATYSSASLNAGPHTLSASIASDTNYNTATSSTVQFSVNQAAQVIDFTQPPSPVVAGTSVVLSATGGASGNPVVFSVLSGNAALADDGVTLTYTGAGTVVVAADQAASADGNYAAATEVPVTVLVNPAASAYNAGTVEVSQQSSVLTATLNFPNGGTLGSLNYLTQGVADLDFIGCTDQAQKKSSSGKGGTPRQTTFACPSTKSKGGTVIPVCSVGTAYSAGQICTVYYEFQPSAPGQRLGGITALDANGSLMGSSYITGTGTGPVAVLTPGTISTVAGTYYYGTASGDGGAATSAALKGPQDVTVDAAGNFYIADEAAQTIRKVTAATGIITTVAGNGSPSYSGDGGPATNASLQQPLQVAVDGLGNLYIADSINNRIREVTAATGIITTVAGSGPIGYNAGLSYLYGNSIGDGGPATSATLCYPTGIAVDGAGNLYISDFYNQSLRMVTAATGIITTVAGNGFYGYTGNGSPITGPLSRPNGLAVDGSGNVYVADIGKQAVWKVTPSTGTFSIIAGNNSSGNYTGDGSPATSAALDNPLGVAVDAAGNVYIADSGNQAVRKVTASTGLITTIAGTGNSGLSGDGGPANVALLNFPDNVALDGAGNLYIADRANARIREVAASSATHNFADTNVGSTSSDSPATVNFANNGYDPTNTNPLTLSSVSNGTTNFVLDSSNACTTSTSLEPGQSCALAVDFTPQVSGAPLTDAVTLVDNSLNNTAATQSVALSGNALQQTPGVTVASASTIYGTPTVGLSATVSFAGTIAPTGAVTFTIDSGSAVAASCTGTTSPLTCTATYPSGTLQVVATHTITASIAATPGFLVSFGTNTLTVTPASASVTPAPSSKVYGTSDPALNGTLTGFLPSDNVVASYSRLAGENVGKYTITATLSPTAVLANYNIIYSTAQFSITKLAASVTPNAATKVYGTSDPVLTGTLSGFLPADGVTATYSRVGGESVAGSPYTISATLSPTAVLANYAITYNTAAFTITQATPALSWVAPSAITYGTALSAAQLNATTSVPGTLVYLPAAGVVPGAGTQTLTVSFTPTDTTDYTSASAQVMLTVNQATPVVTWNNPPSIVYGTATGVAQQTATANVPGSFFYTQPSGVVLKVGSYPLGVAFTPTDTVDYAPVSAYATLTVTQATPVVTWANPPSIVYGTATGAAQKTATATGVGGASLPGSYFYTTPDGTIFGVGTHPLGVAFTPTDSTDYVPVSAYATITVTKATPTVTWSAPAAITYGTALSGAQLNATASVPGTFSYTPAVGTVLHAGTQTLSVTFTPTDSTDYNSVTTTVPLTVNKATPTITWPKPAAINYGTVLGSAQLDATASVPGTFVYSPAAGTLLTGGTQPLSVSFTPTDTTDYNSASATNTITVNESTVSLGVSSGTQTYETWTNFVLGPSWSGNYSTSKAPTGTVTLYDNGVAWVTLPLGPNGLAYYTSNPPLSAGVHNLTVSYSGDANYPPGLSAVVTITVLPAPVNFQASCFGALVYTQAYQCTVNLSASTTSPPVGSIQYSLDGAAPVTVAINSLGNAPFTVSTIPSAGSHTLVITYGGQGNYAAAKPITYNFTTQKGQTELQVSPSTFFVAHGSSVTLSGSATSIASGVPSGTVTFYDNGTAIGTAPIAANGAVSYTVSSIAKGSHTYSASYAGDANYAAVTSGSAFITAF